MYKLIVLSMIVAYASAGLIGAPIALAHAPVAVAHAPAATSYQNSNSLSVHPVPVAVAHAAPVVHAAPVLHSAPIAIAAAPAISLGHGGLGGIGYGLGGGLLH